MALETETPIQEAIRIVGGQSALARLFDVTPQAIQQWAKASAPPERCIAIEEATGGLVTRYDLRPDVFGEKSKEAA